MRVRIEKSGAIEVQTQQFINSITGELDDLIQNEIAIRQRKKNRLDIFVRLGFFMLILCNFCISTFTSFQSKVLPSKPVAFIVWLMIGLFGSTFSLVIYAYYSRTLGKMIKSVHEIPTFTTSRKKELSMKLAVITFMSLCSTVTVTSLFILYLSFYPRIFLLLITLVIQAFQLNIGSLFGTISIIIGNVLALITIYEFIEKRLRKHKKEADM